MIKDGLKARDGYCPCKIEKNEDTKCMCKEFREMESGMCHCGLYIKEGWYVKIPKEIKM